MIKELRTLFRHSSIYGASEVLKKGIGFLMMPIYTHYLMPADYGLLELLDLTLNIIEMLVGLRIGAAVIRYYHHYDKPEDKLEVFSTAFIFACLTALVTLALLEIFSLQVSRWVSGGTENARYFQVIFVCLALQTIYFIPESYLLAQKKSALYATISIVVFVLALSLNIVFIVVFEMGVWGIVLSMLITKLLNCILVVSITIRRVQLVFSWKKFRKMLEYGVPLIFVTLSLFIMHFSDRFFIQKFCSMTDLGLYSLGYKFGSILSVLISAPIFRIWNTQRFEIAKQADAREIFGRVFTYYAAVVIYSGLGISIFIDEVLQIMAASSYEGAGRVVPLIVLSYVLYGMAGFVNLGIMITYRTKYAAYIQMLVAALNIIFNMVFISQYGILGAALSTVLSFFCLSFITLIFSQRFYRIPFEYGRIFMLFISSSFLFWVSLYVNVALLWSIMIKGLLMLIFPAILYVTRFFYEEEIRRGAEFVRLSLHRMGFRSQSGLVSREQ